MPVQEAKTSHISVPKPGLKITSVSFEKGVTSWSGLPAGHRPEVAIVGRSNVGKSSLINLLLERKNVARTSNKPGKTREINYYNVNDALYLVDLPGLGYARTPQRVRARWKALIGDYLTEREQLAAIVHLIDSRHPPTNVDEQILDLVRGGPVPYVIALTKTDKLSQSGRAKAVREVDKALARRGMEAIVVQTSSQAKRGREALWEAIIPLVSTI